MAPRGRDISERRQHEAALVRARVRQRNAIKLANASVEIDKVKVERARGPAFTPLASEDAFDTEQTINDVARR